MDQQQKHDDYFVDDKPLLLIHVVNVEALKLPIIVLFINTYQRVLSFYFPYRVIIEMQKNLVEFYGVIIVSCRVKIVGFRDVCH